MDTVNHLDISFFKQCLKPAKPLVFGNLYKENNSNFFSLFYEKRVQQET